MKFPYPVDHEIPVILAPMAGVSESPFRRICRESFSIPEGSIDGVIEYLNEFGYETNASQAIAMFRDLDHNRRVALARHMADIAKADSKLVDEELRMLKRILEMLDLDGKDLVPAAG